MRPFPYSALPHARAQNLSWASSTVLAQRQSWADPPVAAAGHASCGERNASIEINLAKIVVRSGSNVILNVISRRGWMAA
jgi:hypothetical protein